MKKNYFLVALFFCLFQLSYSQISTQYTFTQSNSSYTAITGGTLLGSATTDDQRFLDPAVPLGSANFTGVGLPIGFNFDFNGAVYNRFGINANGWISLGSSALTPSVDMNSTSSYEPISSTTTTVSNPLVARISAFTRDLSSQNGGSIRYELTGVAPNRVLVVQWTNYSKFLATGDSYNFQIKLYETSNKVEIVYGSMINNATSTEAQCGLRANPNNVASNFVNRTTAVDWLGTTAGSAATNTVLLSNTIFPPSGLVFAWAPPACAGTPTPGNTLSSTASSCNGVSFDLSLQNTTLGSGVTYQWQTSSDGVTFANAAGASNFSVYSTTQSAVTYYRCIVTCTTSTLTETSTPVMVGLNTPSNCYCTPTYTTGKTEGDLISNIVITGTTLSNNSGTAPSNPAFTYFTGQPNYTGTLQAGSSYNVNVSVGTFGGQNVAVWIDYNDDGVFATSERVGFTSASIAGNGSATFPISLACNPPLGTHRMRVRDVYNVSGVNIDPCLNYGWGETEDYNVTVSAAVACPQPTNLLVSNVSSTSATLGWTAGCVETAWNIYVTPAGSPVPASPTYFSTVNPYVVNGLTPGTAYDFYVGADCTTNGVSLLTGPFYFVTSPVNDNCSGAIALTVGNVFGTNPVVGTNAAATNSNPPAPGCASFLGGDVWYSVTVPASGSITLETNPATGSPITDTGLAVYSGSCSNLVLVECDDDDSTNGNFSLVSLTGRTPGEILYFNVWEYSNDAVGQFQVSAYDCPSTTPAPTGDAVQNFCGSATVGDLFADGTNIKWYATATGGTELLATENLLSGTYYASQTVNCESFSRLAVSVTVSPFPVANAASLTVCSNGSSSAVFNLTTANPSINSGTSFTFSYHIDSFEAEINANPIPNPTAFVGTNGQIIFVRVQNTEGCYSIAELTLNITTVAAPTGDSNQTFCGPDTLQDLTVTFTGTDIAWYTTATGGSPILASTVLVSGTTYYASQFDNSCESTDRLAVTVTEVCPFAGCLSSPNGQWPGATFTPACAGTAQSITTIGYAGEYSKVNVINGTQYTFASSIASDVITISDENGTVAYTFGTGSVVWTSTITGVIRFYTHVDNTCAANSISRTRSVLCGTPPPAPSNDNCIAPNTLTVGGIYTDNDVDGTTFGATASTQPNPTTCFGFSGGDVWYTVVVPASGNLTIETSAPIAGGTGVDTVVTAYTGDCAVLTQIGCDDDGATETAVGFTLLSLTGQTPGNTIYLRVYEYNNDAPGAFSISAYDASLSASGFDNSSFSFYPNPVKDVLNLSYSNTIDTVQIFNIIGQEVIAKSINATQATVDMANLPSGAYLVRLTSDSQVKTIKVIKE
ncbi:GEVED domain-containing protein [Flavobacterium sp.]|uniref:GEVED domain-containing protein n=1 Tax=Flavobacterium sp. TaxID=239 RepID=UPI00261C5501|nr:GEVED domain-containing protein [Flavobacterium sp.]